MDSLGERLKRGREEKNISLDDVAKATKINKGILTAIENDQFEFFPPRVFALGFIRIYARYVGLDEKELVDLYNETSAAKKTETPSEEVKVRKKITCRAWYLFLIALFIVTILWGYHVSSNKYDGNKPESEAQKKTASEPAPILPEKPTVAPVSSLKPEAPQAAGEAPSSETQQSAPLAAEEKTGAPSSVSSSANQAPLRLQAKCYATTWVGYTVDQGKTSQIFLFPGDEFSWEWQQTLELKLGNAGGIKVILNGVPLKPLGKAGEVLSIAFGRDTVALRGEAPQKLESWKEEAAESHSQPGGDEKRP